MTRIAIAIAIQVLTELGNMQSRESRLILGLVIVDDTLAIAILSVVTTMVLTGNTTPEISSIAFSSKDLGLFGALLVGTVLVAPRIIH